MIFSRAFYFRGTKCRRSSPSRLFAVALAMECLSCSPIANTFGSQFDQTGLLRPLLFQIEYRFSQEWDRRCLSSLSCVSEVACASSSSRRVDNVFSTSQDCSYKPDHLKRSPHRACGFFWNYRACIWRFSRCTSSCLLTFYFGLPDSLCTSWWSSLTTK